MQQQPDHQDTWVGLLAAIIARARRDASTPTLPDTVRKEAAQFLIWIESEGRELQADLAASQHKPTTWLRGR